MNLRWFNELQKDQNMSTKCQHEENKIKKMVHGK